MIMLPFQAALDIRIRDASPKVREHFSLGAGTHRYRGIMNRIWRRDDWRGRLAKPFLLCGSLANTLFAETGDNIPFELENTVTIQPDGRAQMSWIRTFFFGNRPRRFDAVMEYDAKNRVIIDRIGLTRHLEVELYPRVDDGAIVITSGRQWFRIGRWRLPVPRWFAGTASVREYQTTDGKLGISVTISNPLLGDFFGYEGSFQSKDAV
jgi:hypothetical protein